MEDPAEPNAPVWPAEVGRTLSRLASAGGRVMLLGATDTGKSTLARELVNRGLAVGRQVVVVDADVGQSEIGPPGTIGWGPAHTRVDAIGDIRPEGLYFVGDTTPARHLLPTVLGTSLLVRKAHARKSDLVVIDTTGMVDGRLAGVLKFHKIQAVRPRVLIAVQRRNELEPILAPFAGPGGPRIIRLPIAPAARTKSPEFRRERRERAFAAYFAHGRELVFERSRVALWPPPDGLAAVRGRLCGLLDGSGATLAAGILEDASPYGLAVFAPLDKPEAVATVQMGTLRLTRRGEEL